MLQKLKKYLLEILSLLVALCALFTAAYQADLGREHNRMSVVPILLFAEETLEYQGLSITNKGLGPAIINSIETISDKGYHLYTGSEGFKQVIYNTIENNNIKLHGKDYHLTTYDGYMVIEPGEKVDMLKLLNPDKTKEFQKLSKALDFGVCYKSIYSDRFFIKTGDFMPPDESCNYSGSLKVFNTHYRVFPFLETPLKAKDILGK